MSFTFCSFCICRQMTPYMLYFATMDSFFHDHQFPHISIDYDDEDNDGVLSNVAFWLPSVDAPSAPSVVDAPSTPSVVVVDGDTPPDHPTTGGKKPPSLWVRTTPCGPATSNTKDRGDRKRATTTNAKHRPAKKSRSKVSFSIIYTRIMICEHGRMSLYAFFYPLC